MLAIDVSPNKGEVELFVVYAGIDWRDVDPYGGEEELTDAVRCLIADLTVPCPDIDPRLASFIRYMESQEVDDDLFRQFTAVRPTAREIEVMADLGLTCGMVADSRTVHCEHLEAMREGIMKDTMNAFITFILAPVMRRLAAHERFAIAA